MPGINDPEWVEERKKMLDWTRNGSLNKGKTTNWIEQAGVYPQFKTRREALKKAHSVDDAWILAACEFADRKGDTVNPPLPTHFFAAREELRRRHPSRPYVDLSGQMKSGVVRAGKQRAPKGPS
jgi:hypothetical protein